MKTPIQTSNAPAAIGPYSQGIQANGTAYISGMLGLDPQSGELRPDVLAQAEQALQNLEAALQAAGLTTDHVVKTTVFLTDMAAFGGVNEIYARHFTAPYPARSCVQVAALPKGAQFEIEAIAVG